jgi:hypothetical protein
VLDADATLHDLRDEVTYADALRNDDYGQSQPLAADLRAAGSEGLIYPSRRERHGECLALFYPDLASNVVQGRHLDYHWDGRRVDLYRDATSGDVYRIEPDAR